MAVSFVRFSMQSVAVLRYVLAVGIGLVAAPEAHGQWEIGASLGVNRATQRYQQNSQHIREKALVLFHVGLTTVFNLGPNLAVHSDLLLTTLGTRHSLLHTHSYYTLGEHSDELQYLMLPVAMVGRISLSPSRPHYLVVGGGPYVAWLTYAESTKRGETFTDDLNVGDDKNDNYRTFDAGMNMQAVYEISGSRKLASLTIFGGVVVTYGMLNVLPHGDDATGRYNRAVSLTSGIRVRLQRQQPTPIPTAL
jgi:hypothetical protein